MRQRPDDSPEQGKEQEPRRAPRLKPEQVSCSLGEVLDLSTTGVRLRSGHLKVGTMHALRLACCNQSVTLKGEIMWSKKVAFRTYESGVQFAEMDAPTSQALARVVTLSRNQRTM